MSSPCISPDTLKNLCGEDRALLEELLTLFQNEAPLQLQAMDTAVAANDYASLKVAAHTLKGSASYIGAPALVEACHQLEQVALKEEIELCDNLLKALKNMLFLTQEALKAEFGV